MMAATDADHGDAWDDLSFDDEFIAQAQITEPSAQQRSRDAETHARAELLPIRLVLERQSLARRTKRTDRWRRRAKSLLAFAVFTGLMSALVVAARNDIGRSTQLAVYQAWGGATPTPARSASSTPLSRPPVVEPTEEPHDFLARQPDQSPVAYDPCRPIHYVTNTEAGPQESAVLLTNALSRISAATGLQFIDDGPTDEPPTIDRRAFQPERYGDKWVPVLIAWTNQAAIPDLAGSIAGVGGSSSVSNSNTGPRSVYVTGIVYLDGPQLAQALREFATADQADIGRANVEAVVVHELGHLVGLQHVDDPTQIMNPATVATELGNGDRTGLAMLGRGRCVSRL